MKWLLKEFRKGKRRGDNLEEEQTLTSVFDSVSCHFPQPHKIPVREISRKNGPKNPIEELFIVCDQKHILLYEYNPISFPDSPLRAIEEVTRHLKEMNNKYYETVFLELPHEVGIHYEAFQNFYTLQYAEGAAVSIRILIELFIRDNYGNFIWRKAPNKESLHIKSDKPVIDELIDELQSPTLGSLLKILSGDTRASDDLGKLVRSRLSSTSANKLWVSQSDFVLLKNAYQKTSEIIHKSDMTVKASNLSATMDNVLSVIKKYFQNNNKWGVEYGQ